MNARSRMSVGARTGDDHTQALIEPPGSQLRTIRPVSVFAFMTTEPNALTASINHERMPVLISDPTDFETWLSGSTEDAFQLARSYAADQMRIVQSGSEREDLLRAA